MKELIIKNFGPLDDVCLHLKRINLLIGPQSSGKSCILKIASFCAWTEKMIELYQDAEKYLGQQAIENNLICFHHLQGYANQESFFSFETDTMKFSFSFENNTFDFKWKEGRWNYQRSKIAYILAERNVLSVVPNWYEVSFSNSNIRYFLAEWQNVRNYIKTKSLNILNTGVAYHYNEHLNADKIILENAVEIDFQNASSGLQSVVPLCSMISYVYQGVFNSAMSSLQSQKPNIKLILELQARHPQGKTGIQFPDKDFFVVDNAEIQKVLNSFMNYQHSDIYLEEPEENLFPETQVDLVNWIVRMQNTNKQHSLFVATHSPYIMSAFNNLVQLGEVINEHPEKAAPISRILPADCAVEFDHLSAYSLTDGHVDDILDQDLRLISPSLLDTASDKISEVFSQLLEI